MERVLLVNQDYLCFPIAKNAPEVKVEIFDETNQGAKIMEFMIPVSKEEALADFYAQIPVKSYHSHQISIRGLFTEAFAAQISNREFVPANEVDRPLFHYTTGTGWMNDPNGLLFANGTYHMYYQYNPFSIAWNNMCWGHATSKDLLHWTEHDLVLVPDEEGMMFSGSGIVNDRTLLNLPKDALLFFYTAAGNFNPWSKGKESTQRIAYSLDGGLTLHKYKKNYVDTICTENRDPKVFWHEESNSYIMVLWLENNDYGILRSSNLETWELASKLTIENAWECPDLFQVKDDKNEAHWVFWSADGYYCFGEFDGFEFKRTSKVKKAYFNEVPYAAQTYSGTMDQTILVPWFRLPNADTIYTGAMAIPKELRVVSLDGELFVTQHLIEQWECAKKVSSIEELKAFEAAFEIQIELNYKGTSIELFGNQIRLDDNQSLLEIGDQQYDLSEKVNNLTLILDKNVLEILINNGSLVAAVPFVKVNDRICLGENDKIFSVK